MAMTYRESRGLPSHAAAAQPGPAQPAAPGDEAPPGAPGTGETVCRTCGGTGRTPGGQADCPDCGGTGKVTAGIGGG
jgi:hypothetical protein